MRKFLAAAALAALALCPLGAGAQLTANSAVGLQANGSAVFGGNSQAFNFATAGGVIGSLGSVTGGSSYTTGTQILSLGAITAGTLYTTGTYNGVALTGGTGSGATANIIVLGGGVVQVTLVAPGTGYLAADSLSATAASIGGTGSGFSIPVSTVGYAGVALTGGLGSGATANIKIAAGAVSTVTLVSGGQNYTTSDTLSATAASIGGTGSGFTIPVSLVGSPSSAGTSVFLFANTISGVCVSNCVLNSLTYNTDSLDASTTNKEIGWQWNWNGTSGKGYRVVGNFIANVNVVPADTNGQYVALGTIAQAAVNVGGTSGSGNGQGDLFGFNPYCRLVAGATFWSQCVGQEIDMSLQYGASADQMIGEQVVQDGNFLVSANLVGIAYSANNASGAIGWDFLLADGSYAGFHSLKSTGTLIGCQLHADAGNCGTIGAGLDLNNYSAVTNYILRGPGANGYIDGSFNVHAPTFFPTSTASCTTNGASIQAGGNTNQFEICANGSAFVFTSASVINNINGMNLEGNGHNGVNISSTGIPSLPSITNAAGNEILCTNTTGFAITYESSVSGCVPSDPKLKNLGHSLNPFVAMVRVGWYLEAATWTWKDTKRFDKGEHIGFRADEVCALDNRLCLWDSEGTLNYDKVGLTAYLEAALRGAIYSVFILFGLFIGDLHRRHRKLHKRMRALEVA